MTAQPSLEYFWKRECENSIPVTRRHHNLFVNGIDFDSVHIHPRNLGHRDSPMRGNVSVIVDTPNADPSARGGCDNPAFRRIHVRFAAPEFRLRTGDDA